MIINAKVTISGKIYDVSGAYVVKDIDAAAGTYFDCGCTQPQREPGRCRHNADGYFNRLERHPVREPGYAGAEGGVSERQSLLAPVVRRGNNAPFTIDVGLSGTEYVVEAPAGCKFDLGEWWMRTDNGKHPRRIFSERPVHLKMKSSSLTSAGAAGISPYQWNAFSYQLGLSWGPIQPPAWAPYSFRSSPMRAVGNTRTSNTAFTPITRFLVSLSLHGLCPEQVCSSPPV